MKILVNASTSVVGGGVQVASTFIRHALRYPSGHVFSFGVSPAVMSNISPLLLPQYTNVVILSPSPARDFTGHGVRKRLRSLEMAFQPDIVFSIGAPSYTSFKAPEAAFFADGWVSHPTPLAFKNLSLLGRVERHLVRCYKASWLRNVAFFQVEAQVCKDGLVHNLGITEDRVHVIPNSFSDVFLSQLASSAETVRRETSVFRVFTLANPYPHKNLIIIPEVATILRRQDPSRDYRFTVTLPDRGSEVRRFWQRAKSLDVVSSIENVGPLKLEQLPDLYRKSDIVFLPSLLETFSATYPEAMFMEKPIVTTDLDFAHDVCGDAALYYTPTSAVAAAEAIARVAVDEALTADLVKKGRERVKVFPSPQEKYQMQMEWLESCLGSAEKIRR